MIIYKANYHKFDKIQISIFFLPIYFITIIIILKKHKLQNKIL